MIDGDWRLQSSTHDASLNRDVAVVELQTMQRRGLVQLLGSKGYTVVFEGRRLIEALSWLKHTERASWPSIMVLDPLSMGTSGESGLGMLRALRSAGVRVVALSSLDIPPIVNQLVHVGLDGIVSKRDSEEVFLALLAAVAAGGGGVTQTAASIIGALAPPRLSDQERRLLELYVGGSTIRSAAEEIGVREDTAKKYLSRIKAKYADAGYPVHSKLELARAAWNHGFPSGVTGLSSYRGTT